MSDRQRGVQIHRPVIYGSHARLLTETEKSLAPPGHTHRWTVFFTSATSGPPKQGEQDDLDILPGGYDDLTYLVKRVTFRLHETYPNPSRVCEKPPFQVTETGWGEFGIQIRIQFVAESVEKPLVYQHQLKLHHWGPPVEGPLPNPEPTSASINPTGLTGTPAPLLTGTTTGSQRGSALETEKKKEKEEEGDDDVKMESSTPKPAVPPTEGEEASKSERSTPAPRSGTPSTRLQAAASSSGPVSVASKIPVLAWQYDEIVFCDPPLSFYNLMNEHPPTSLPAKNRRPRDQREEYESQKKAKAGPSSRPSLSRQATTDGETGAGAEGEAKAAQTPVTGETPAPAPLVGIPGEMGSADVPLEFSNEMERGEWNKLHEAKRKIIEETDRWRSKLIEGEKEMARIKEEMAAMG